VNPDITLSYKGSSWQIAEYKHKQTDEIWIAKIPASPPEDLCREVLGAHLYTVCGVCTSPTLVTRVDILVPSITEFLQHDLQYAIASKKIECLNLFGDGFISLLTQLPSQIQQQSEIQTQQPVYVRDGVKLIGLWELLAVATWIGDWDCLGRGGKNAGYVLTEKGDALTFKIDTGFYGFGFSKHLTKHIHVSPDQDIIHFDSIANPDKIIFLQKIMEITNLTDDDILNMTTLDVHPSTPRIFQDVMSSDEFLSLQRRELTKRRDQLRELYEVDLKNFLVVQN